MPNTRFRIRVERSEPDADPSCEPLMLERTPDHRLCASIGNERCMVVAQRCFPWSAPGQFISLRSADGKEFALVIDPADLSAAAREVLERALAEAGFIFQVHAVLAIEEEIELRHWHVQTSQGSRRFQTRLDDWPRRLPDGGLLIRDVTGDLYRLEAPGEMDRKSRALLWAFVD